MFWISLANVFSLINAAVFINFFMIWERRLLDGGVYKEMLFIFLNNQP